MTTRALVHTDPWDFDRARDSLRARVVAVRGRLGGHEVCATPEPLLKAGGDGQLWQSVRLTASALQDQASRAQVVVRTAGGTVVPHRVEPGPAGIRVLVPEVSEATALSLEIPDLAAGDTLPLTVSPQRHWSIHLVHHTHLDIGYTDPQGVVLAEHLSFLDSCLDLTRQTEGWPADAQFRWAVEALWSFDQWTRARPASVVDEFVDRVRQGRIELTAMPFNLHTEACATDELHELMRMARTVSSRYGLRFDTAMQTDVPGAVAGLVDVLAQNGVRYLSVAHNWAGRSVPHLTGGQDLPRLFRWRAPSGDSVLVWVTDTPHGLAYMEGPMLGFDHDYPMVDDLLPAYLASLASNPYPYDANVTGFACGDAPLHRAPYPWDVLHLRVQGKFGDNAPPRRLIAETVRRWNETWAFPHLRLSRNSDFFRDAETRLGDSITDVQGDWNDWWADGIGSGARPLQLARRAQATLPDAQTISTLAGLRGAPAADEDTRAAAGVYHSASLFNEHTWGSANPWTYGDAGMDSGDEQWHWKYSTALAAHDDAATLLSRAASRLTSTCGTGDAALASFQVVNTCSYPRSDVARAFLPDSRVGIDTPVTVRDGRTGMPLPFEQHSQVNPKHRDAGRLLDIAVTDVPATGMIRVDVLASDGPAPVAVQSREVAETVLEDERLRVEADLSRAGITSIRDKSTGRELVNADATFAFNSYVYDEYISAGGMNHASGRLESRPDLNLLGTRSLCRPAALIERGCSPLRQWLTYESAAPGAHWVRTTLTLWLGSGRLDVTNRIAKAPTTRKESAYFAFPFALDHPTTRVEVSGGVTGTALPAVPGGAAHMRAMRHWVSLADGVTVIAWATRDAPLVQFEAIAVPYPPFPASTPGREPATIYSWVHNNLWDTNFPGAQGFEADFAYSIASGPAGSVSSGPVLAARTADALCRPLRAVLSSALRATNEPAEASAVRVDDERVQIVGLTTPEPGRVLVRLQSLAGEPVDVRVIPAARADRAWHASFLGDPIAELPTPAHPIRIGAFGTAAALLTWE